MVTAWILLSKTHLECELAGSVLIVKFVKPAGEYSAKFNISYLCKIRGQS